MLEQNVKHGVWSKEIQFEPCFGLTERPLKGLREDKC